jgi:hypothetical protein
MRPKLVSPNQPFVQRRPRQRHTEKLAQERLRVGAAGDGASVSPKPNHLLLNFVKRGFEV